LQIAGLSAGLALVSKAQTPLQALLRAWLFATVWLTATFWWLYIAMHTYGGLQAVLAAAAVVSLAAALAAYYAFASLLYWQWRGQRPYLATLLFAALWTAAEMARGTWLTGFGWGAVGYAHTEGPLAFYVPWVGAYGVGALAAWLAASLAWAPKLGWSQTGTAAAVLLVGVFGPAMQYGWTHPSGTLGVALLQGNIPQDEKFQTGTGVRQALIWYGDQLMRSDAQLVVAPETAIPVLPLQLPDAYWTALRDRFGTGQQAAMIGIPLGSEAQGYTNAVIGLRPGDAQPWHYDKHHLVPFGEFIPPLFKWFTRLMNIPLGDFNRGAVGQPSMDWLGQRLAANICYEDLFGEELGARFANPALAPTIFVNVSNLAWFGDSIAIDQHLNISRMRALEFERPFVRATNTGATAIIDHQGRVTAQLPRFTQGVLRGAVEGRTGITPFAWWVARWGLWPLWIMVVGIVAVAWLRHRLRP
jgi:apolipoprotein N-acyltransferase